MILHKYMTLCFMRFFLLLILLVLFVWSLLKQSFIGIYERLGSFTTQIEFISPTEVSCGSQYQV